MNTHAAAQSLLPLEETTPDGRTFLNASVWFVDSDGYRVVFRWHEPLYRVGLTDEVHLRLVAVALRQSGLATQEEICHAFGHSVSTQARWERQYRKYGIDGLVSKKPSGRDRELDKSQEGFVRKWFRAGCSNRQMAKRLGVDEATIRRTLKRLGLARKPAVLPRLLPEIEDQAPQVASVEAIARSATTVVERTRDASAEVPLPAASSPLPNAVRTRRRGPGRVARRIDVHRGPRSPRPQRRPVLGPSGAVGRCGAVVRRSECLPRAGVLLAVPLLVRHGLIEAFAKVYGSLHPSFYGLRTIVVTLFLGGLAADQAARTFERIRPGGPGSDPGAGPGAGSQDGAAEVHAAGGDGARRDC